jgi:hypothetical protein
LAKHLSDSKFTKKAIPIAKKTAAISLTKTSSTVLTKSNSNLVAAPSMTQQFQAKSKATTRPSSPRNHSLNSGNTGGERLEVTVIPVDEEPYSKIVTIP